jgi:hypothetical protein
MAVKVQFIDYLLCSEPTSIDLHVSSEDTVSFLWQSTQLSESESTESTLSFPRKAAKIHSNCHSEHKPTLVDAQTTGIGQEYTINLLPLINMPFVVFS